jgi:hypothetical protein
MSIHQIMLPAEIGIRERYRNKLLNGEGILLKHDDLTGPHKVYLNKKQYNRLIKARKSGTGMRLKLMEGSGIFDTIGSLGKSAYTALKPAIKEGLMQGSDMAIDYASKPIKAKIAELLSQDVADKTIDFGKSLGRTAVGSMVGSGLTSTGKKQNFRKGHLMIKKTGSETAGQGIRAPGY